MFLFWKNQYTFHNQIQTKTVLLSKSNHILTVKKGDKDPENAAMGGPCDRVPGGERYAQPVT